MAVLTVRPLGNLTFNGKLTVETVHTDGMTWDNATNDPDLVIQGGLEVTETSGSIAWTQGTGSLTFSGTGNQVITTPSSFTEVLEDIIVNKASGILKLAGDVYTDTFTGTNGNFDLDGNVIYSDGNVDINGATGFQFYNGVDNSMDDGKFDLDGGSLTLDGDAGTQLEINDLDFDLAGGVTGTATYCDVEDSICTYVTSELDATDASNNDIGGTNTGWDFGGGGVLVTPTAVSAVGTTVDPTVVLGPITPTPASAVGATVAPTVVEGALAITPTPLSAVGTTVDPTVVEGALAITPTPLSAVGTTVDPTVVLGSDSVTPTPASAVGTTVDPTVAEGAISPAPAAAVGTTVNPTVVAGAVSVTPTPAAAVGAAVDPSVLIGAITPAPASAVGTTVAPTVVMGSTSNTPTPVSAIGTTVNPTVVAGAVSVTPTSVSAVGTTVDPSVLIGAIVPDPASAVGTTVAPTVVLGPTSNTPTPTSAVGTTVDPVVVISALAVTPTPASAVGVTVDPDVIQSALAISPAVVAAIGATVDPSVLLSGSVIVIPDPVTAIGTTVAPTVVTESGLGTLENLPRWVMASVTQYFQTLADSVTVNSTLMLFVEGIDERTDDNMRVDRVELRVNGPSLTETSKDYFLIDVGINLLLVKTMDMDSTDVYDLTRWSGIFQNAMLVEIPVYRYGPGSIDDDSLIGCLRVKNRSPKAVQLWSFGQIDKNNRVRQNELDGLYEMELGT